MPTIEVTTPSRLHFGMFSFGRSDVRQYGGVGVMIDKPGLALRIEPAEQFEVSGPLARRVRATVARLSDSWQLTSPPACRLEILHAPPEHAGLGTGTQLELAVTAGLNAFRGGEPLSALELARLGGRGARSAIGTYGFLLGGLLVESGKTPSEALSPLERRVELPADWRFVLITLPHQRGLAGDAERRAFGQLPPVPVETTLRLRSEAETQLLPAALDGQFERFSESLYRFGYEAGLCFAAAQGGPFASKQITDLVGLIRDLGIAGVGQSSWGPTVFALLPSEGEALDLTKQLALNLPAETGMLVTSAAVHGATLATATKESQSDTK